MTANCGFVLSGLLRQSRIHRGGGFALTALEILGESLSVQLFREVSAPRQPQVSPQKTSAIFGFKQLPEALDLVSSGVMLRRCGVGGHALRSVVWGDGDSV
jgi:hypothetical protein